MSGITKIKNRIKRVNSNKLIGSMMLIIIILTVIVISMLKIEEQQPTAVIAGCLTDVEEYTYQKYRYNYVDEYEDPREIFNADIPMTVKSFVYAIPGSINYGFDMTGIDEDDIKVNKLTKEITVRMPELFILSHEQFTEEQKTYAEVNNILNLITVEDTIKVQADAKEKAEAEAIALGVIAETQDSAQISIAAMINALPEYNEYTVTCVFKEQNEVRHIDDVKKNETRE